MEKVNVVFVEPEAKVNSEYYCEHVLKRGLLHVTQATCGRHKMDFTGRWNSISHSQKHNKLSSSEEC